MDFRGQSSQEFHSFSGLGRELHVASRRTQRRQFGEGGECVFSVRPGCLSCLFMFIFLLPLSFSVPNEIG